MAAPLDNQGFHNERHYRKQRDSQPEIIVLAHRKSLIEPARLFEKFPRHHHRGGADQAELKAGAKDLAGRLSVPLLRIYPDAPTYPHLFRLTDPNLRPGGHESRLDLQLAAPPQVVRIEKSHIFTGRVSDPEVARRGHPPPLLAQHPELRAIRSQPCRCFIRRAIIDDDKLEVSAGLGKDRVDRFTDHWPTVVGRDNDAYEGGHVCILPSLSGQRNQGTLTAAFCGRNETAPNPDGLRRGFGRVARPRQGVEKACCGLTRL